MPGWTRLVAYADQTCGLYRGDAYCWGDNANHQLGIAPAIVRAAQPTRVILPAGTVTAIAEGANDGCAIVDGTAYCYGLLTATTATEVATGVAQIAAGNGFLCFVAGTALSCWGSNADLGELANGDYNPRVAPTPALLVKTTALSLGDDHGCAVDDGRAMCWGHNDFGTLGVGSTMPGMSAQPLAVFGNPVALPLIAGWHACALTGGQVACWGEGDHGELGDGMMTSANAPVAIASLSNVTALAVGGGPADLDASCAVANGVASCWGAGKFGRLGQGTASNSGVPVEVAGLPAAARELAIGYDHACALLVTDEVWCWGKGGSGQLGDGRMLDSLQPVRAVTPM
ncbi:MAG TPA: hypothetical protein VIV58_06655 [Kofleriaceae bacterium]